jgi:hypothetical protein
MVRREPVHKASRRFGTVVEELEANRPIPSWLARDEMTGRVPIYPNGEDVEYPNNESLVLAFYAC